MSEMLFLYKELTKMAKANTLNDNSLRFTVTLNEEFGDMINELSKRTNVARAELARHLICTALSEIDAAYNLQNDPYFDYSITAQVEEELGELELHRDVQEVQKKINRISELEFTLRNFESLNNTPEEKEKYLKLITDELKVLREEVNHD